ncbi:urea ABC transporter permease subunit UrtB [Streptomyces sp. NPDC059837]|jgi:urea transport system permease protein|uniref:urea ABC transporter permease subunit UrtB n=1 Tax=unclassified Streptomyces TaxID=2593676 RepID=UPI002258EC18|nr:MULTISPECIES: urea ABC transporter permease subunit UrtB [unclassified Streptomyces]MCX4405471.1 urea ABC transporter permease subunit UrtB [Streptomyces sp. NBC_01764]MCX4459338.1 urea ABC transporter permease subunit UrtB [Streptomyces sp. NBC_01719]MCX4498695.1 urea ABC transporter permease subunit UrtB [Streptomyces sp. NBC_01728]MCX4595402.1 urea ABC transporter permease subunit UrtB [Streptomyces sp. NBC_01549]MCX5189977.1 urea ABC transporter permease subunit UrtB [Streptomyces sp. N
MTVILGQMFTGVSIGAVLLLIALGLSLTFGQMNVINMAHGEFIMAGAYTTYVLQKSITGAGLSLIVALPVAFLVSGALGALLEWLLIRRLYLRPLDTLLVTWGVSLMLQQLARDIFGAPNVQTRAPDVLTGNITVIGGDDPLTFASSRLFILGLAIAAVVALSLTLRLTPLGRRIRAVVQNRDLAEVSGISTGRVDRTAFFIGSGLAGIAGVALTLVGPIGPTMGTNVIIDAFLVIVVGGIGQLKGSVIVAFVLGVLQSVLEYSTTVSVAKVLVLVAIVAFLQWRPQGLYTVRTRSLV